MLMLLLIHVYAVMSFTLCVLGEQLQLVVVSDAANFFFIAHVSGFC